MRIDRNYVTQMNDIENKVAFLEHAIGCIFDIHTPEKTVKCRMKKVLPYWTDNIKAIIELKNKARKKYF